MRIILLILLVIQFSPSMSQLKSFDGNNIYTEVKGEGPYTLLFIHGWNLDHSFWDTQVERFSGDFKVVTMDLPGYGSSGKDRSDWSMDAYGRDVRSVIDGLNLTNVILIAHSMGGNIALSAIHQNNNQIVGLIGVDNFKQVGAEQSEEEAGQVTTFIQMLRADYSTNVRLTSEGFMFSSLSPVEPKERVLLQYASQDPEVAISVIEGVFAAGPDEALFLSEVKVPFAVISSTYIPIYEEGIKANYSGPDFRVYLIDRCGHFPMVERPDEFNALLAKALTEMF